MSLQAGLRYFDDRPVTPAEVSRFLDGLDSEDDPISSHRLQPGLLMAYAGRRRTPEIGDITFDGRLDNRDDLLLQLEDSLEAGAGDADLALAAYRCWGAAGFVRLVGDWSLAIWDDKIKTMLLASDYAGVRPLYYCLEKDRLCWSTRLRALVEFTGIHEIDDEYVANLLGCCECHNRTPYRGIRSAPAGCCVRVANGALSVERFWVPPVGNCIEYQRESAYEEALRALFRDSVRCRLPQNEPLISELSGGLDSSSIASMARRLGGRPDVPRLVTITMEHAESLDTRFYSLLERRCNTKPVHLATRDHVFLSEDYAGGIAPAGWQDLHLHIAAIARQAGASVYMTGQLGDFIMGNRWDDSDQVSGLLRRGHISAALRESLSWSKVLRIPVYWVLWRALFPGDKDRVDGPYSPRSAEDSIAPEFRKQFAGRVRTGEIWRAARPERRRHYRELMQILESRRLQPPEPLQHLAYTHPYSHRPLVEFMMSIPSDVVCGPGEPRRLMRRAFHDLWPPELRKRRSKDSFTGVLLENLRPLAARLAEKPSQLLVVERGYVEPKSFTQRLGRLVQALDCNEPQLRQIMTLELWLRQRAGPDAALPAPGRVVAQEPLI